MNYLSDDKTQKDAGWTDAQFDMREAAVDAAAMRVFRTSDSWKVGKNNMKKRSELRCELAKVGDEFHQLGKNGWYKHNNNRGQYLAGLKDACYCWALDILRFKYEFLKGRSWCQKRGTGRPRPDRPFYQHSLPAASPGEDGAAVPSSNSNVLTDLANGTSSVSTHDQRIRRNAKLAEHRVESISIKNGASSEDNSRGRSPEGTSDDPILISPDKNFKQEVFPPRQSGPSTDAKELEIDWRRMIIEIDRSDLTLDTRVVFTSVLMPKNSSNSHWSTFDPQTFLEEFNDLYTDCLSINGNKNTYSVIYSNENGRFEIIKNGVVKEYGYKAMLSDFSETRRLGQSTIKLTIEGAARTLTSVDSGLDTVAPDIQVSPLSLAPVTEQFHYPATSTHLYNSEFADSTQSERPAHQTMETRQSTPLLDTVTIPEWEQPPSTTTDDLDPAETITLARNPAKPLRRRRRIVEASPKRHRVVWVATESASAVVAVENGSQLRQKLRPHPASPSKGKRKQPHRAAKWPWTFDEEDFEPKS